MRGRMAAWLDDWLACLPGCMQAGQYLQEYEFVYTVCTSVLVRPYSRINRPLDSFNVGSF